MSMEETDILVFPMGRLFDECTNTHKAKKKKNFINEPSIAHISGPTHQIIF